MRLPTFFREPVAFSGSKSTPRGKGRFDDLADRLEIVTGRPEQESEEVFGNRDLVLHDPTDGQDLFAGGKIPGRPQDESREKPTAEWDPHPFPGGH